MKILYVITKSNYGGAQRYIFDLATHMVREGEDVVVALGGTGTVGAPVGRLHELLSAAGVHTRTVTAFTRDLGLTRDLKALRELVSIIRAERPDVLHVTSSKAGGLGALAGRVCRVPRIIFTSHGLTYDETWRPWWQRSLIYAFTWLTIALSHTTVMISNETFHRARKLPLVGHKVHLVQNGIEEHAQQSRDEARADLVTRCPTLGTVRNAPWIGTIAELHPNKRVEILIDALIALRGHGIEAELVIIGDGERAGALREHSMASPVSAHVHFLGFVPDAARTIPAFDLFTLASVKEGLPYVLIECASAGCPAVVTDIGGNRDVVKDGMNGLLVEPSAESFARAYEMILKDGSTARSMGDAARRVFAANFTLARMVRETHSLYVSPKPSNSRS